MVETKKKEDKKKTTKTKKKVDKKKIKKQLKKKQKEMPKKEFKKLAKKVKSKLEERTLGGQALENIASRLRQNVPPLPIFNPQIAAKQTKERLETETKKEFAKPIKDFKNMKKKYEEVLMKYNNGQLDATDLFELYAETKQFANTANEYLPSRNEISNAYKTLKSKLTYFRNFINNNRPSGQNPLQETIIPTVRQQRQQPPPTPPPTSNNQAPPPPQNSPTPQPPSSQPTPVPTPSPTLSNIINSVIPEASPQNLAIGAMATLGSGAAMLNRMAILRNQRQLERLQGENILNRGRNLVEAGLGQAVGNQLQQVAQNTLNEIAQAQQNLENVENIQNQRGVDVRQQRPPLRQRTIDRQARQALRRQTLEERKQNRLAGESETPTKTPRRTESEKLQEETDELLGEGFTPGKRKAAQEASDKIEAGILEEQLQAPLDTLIREDPAQELQQEIPDMPEIPMSDLQTRTQSDIMEQFEI